jgi:asparagine synthetase B (glutamine-hydrolysing)
VDEQLYVMAPIEVAWGYVVGHEGELPPALDPTLSPRRALESEVREALRRPPCGVAFSGGRDSSLVLAVATDVARREGFPDPIPITRIFPAVAAAEEGRWQETVIRHLGLRDWQRLEFDDELDVVGPIAQEHLVEHGVVWPPTIGADRPMVDAVRGGALIDGEGGDEVLGVAAHRVAPITRVVRSPRPVRWSRIRSALGAVAPTPLRRRHVRRVWERVPMPWLRPWVRDALESSMDRVELHQPVSFAASVRLVPRRRTQLLGARNRRLLAEAHGVHVFSPLLRPEFVHALARDGGVLGRGDRTAVLRAMASDLLPDAVLGRTSKATFASCYVAAHSRELIADWNGEGVDDELVDPIALKRAWENDPRMGPTTALLQIAWLAMRPSRPHSATDGVASARRADIL